MGVSVTWLGHASFKLVGSRVVYIDPWKIADPAHDGELVLISHIHQDHYSVSDIHAVAAQNGDLLGSADVVDQEGRGHALVPGGEYAADGITVRGVAAYNIEKQFHPKANNWLGFIIEMDGITVYYAGDTDAIEEMSTLPPVDLALLPIGGKYTMNAEEAVQAAATISPHAAVPYHWGDIIGSASDAEAFSRDAGCQVCLLSPGGETIV